MSPLPKKCLKSETLRSLARDGRLATPLASIAASCVHMTVNRMLRARARAHELVIYDFLERLDAGRAARVRAAARARPATVRGPGSPVSALALTAAPGTLHAGGA